MSPTISRLSIIGVVVLGAACVVADLAQPLSWSHAFAPWYDTTYMFGPVLCEFGRQWASGHVPLLDGSTYEPLHASANVTAWYPGYLFGAVDFCGIRSAIQGSDIVGGIHVGILYVNTIVLARMAGLRWVPAVFAAVAFALSRNTREVVVFPTIVAAEAWIPLALAGLIAVLDRQKWLLGLSLTAFAVTALLYANPGSNMIAPLVLMGGLVGGWYFATMVAERQWSRAKASALALAVALIAILAMNVASSVNLYLGVPNLIRWTQGGPVIGFARPLRPLNVQEILREQQGPAEMLSVLVPPTKAYALGSFFVGPLVASLALFALLTGWKRRAVQACALVVAVCLYMFFLDGPGLTRLWSLIPGLNHVRHLSVVATAFVLASAILSGCGLQHLMSGNPERRRLWVGLCALALVLPVLALFLHREQAWLPPVAGWIAVAGVAVLATAPYLPGRHWIVTAAVLAIPVQVAAIQWHPGQAPPEMRNYENDPTWKALEAAVRWVRTTDPDPGRLVFDGNVRFKDVTYGELDANSAGAEAIYEGVPTFQFYLQPREFWKFEQENYRFADRDFYAQRGGKYVIAASAANLTSSAPLEAVYESPPFRVYRNREASSLLRALCLKDGGAGEGGAAKRARLPDAPAALGATLSVVLSKSAPCPETTIRGVNRVSASEYEWLTEPGRGRILLFNLPAFAAWKMRVGQSPVSLFNLGDSQVLAVLPDGVSGMSVLQYVPTAYYVRVAVSGIALILFGAFVVLAHRLGWFRAGWFREPPPLSSPIDSPTTTHSE